MRAVFTVDLPQTNEGQYPSDRQLIEYLRSFGWEPVEICSLEDEDSKLAKCRQLGEYLFQDMPTTAASRLEHVIFYGYLSDDYTRFVVLKLVNGQMTFRLANDTLGRLQTSTAKIIKKLLNKPLNDKTLSVCNQAVVIYERGNDYVVLNGRVIPNPLRETLRSDKKSMLLALVALLIFSIVITILTSNMTAGTSSLFNGTLERISTAMLTAALVSVLNLTETYLEIYRNRVVVW